MNNLTQGHQTKVDKSKPNDKKGQKFKKDPDWMKKKAENEPEWATWAATQTCRLLEKEGKCTRSFCPFKHTTPNHKSKAGLVCTKVQDPTF